MTVVLRLFFSSMCGWSEYWLFLKGSLLELHTEIPRDEMLGCLGFTSK